MPTLVGVVRELLQDNNPDATKRIFKDEEISRVLKTYMTTTKQLRLVNTDGLLKRYESGVPYWMDGVRSHLSDDETTEYLFESVIYVGLDKQIVDASEYVVDFNDGAIIYSLAQPEGTYVYATFYSSNPFHAAADLLDELAAKKARSALGVQLGALSVNLAKLPVELRKQADQLRAQGGFIVSNNMRSDRPVPRNRPSDFRRTQ